MAPTEADLTKLGCEVLLVLSNPVGYLGPPLRRTKEDVSELVPVGANPTGVIERSRIDGSYTGSPFKREPDIRPALRTELKVKPTSRFVRDMPVLR